jgi:hypothetical protein
VVGQRSGKFLLIGFKSIEVVREPSGTISAGCRDEKTLKNADVNELDPLPPEESAIFGKRLP